MDETGPTDPLGHWVHRSLLGGLIVSGLLLLAGLAVALLRHESRPTGPPPPVGVVVRRAVAGDGVALMGLGLLALMATPVVRVTVLAVGWGMERDRRFLAVALVVLALLAVSVALGVG